MTNLDHIFANVKGYKTRAGAQRKIDAQYSTRDTQRTTAEREQVLMFPYQRTDGTWIPVAILNDKNEWVAGMLASRGVCVTKA